MVIPGNITISSRPDPDSLRTDCVCLCCLEECDEVGVDESFGDSFGNVTCWGTGSSCCGGEVAEGRIFFQQTDVYTARKDHYNKRGKLIIKAGQRYRRTLKKGYYVDDRGEHHGIFNLTKKALDPQPES